MPDEERWQAQGRGYFEPVQPVVAGAFTTLTFHFEIGQTGIPVGGRLRVVWRWPLDWADLQTEDPRADGYMVVSTTGSEDVEMRATYLRRGDLIPWNHQIELEVTRGELQPGDQVHLRCGEKSGGGRGWGAPTFSVPAAGFLMLINPDRSDKWLQLTEVPGLPIVPGPPLRLVVVSPSGGMAGEHLEVVVRAEDQWGNAALVLSGPPAFEVLAEGGEEQAAVTVEEVELLEDHQVYRFRVRCDQAGACRFRAAVPGTGLQAESNPVRIHSEPPALRLFWGDLHAGQGEIGCGVGSLAHFFTFVRDAAGLQFASYQPNDHHVTLEEWQEMQRETEAFDDPGRFVTFLGYEWSPPSKDGGDRNVVFRRDEARLRRSARYFTESEPDPEPDLPNAPVFHEAMRGEEVLLNLHAGGRTVNLDYHAPEIEPLVEIHSTHGTSDWLVEDALRRGYRVGITGGTDGVDGHPGAAHPGTRLIRNVRSGFTGVYARDLSREALWEALQARRCYATSGERIRLWVEVDGHPMGAEYETREHPLISIAAAGTAPIEQVDLLCGIEVICSWNIALPNPKEGMVRILWGGTQNRGTTPAQRVVWDGQLRVSGGRLLAAEPVGFQSPCDQVHLESDEMASFRAATAGNRSGLVLELEGDEETVCRFSSKPCSFDFRLDQVRLAPMKVDAGGVGRHVMVGPVPAADGPCQVKLTFRDLRNLSGVLPYWVRVVQVDQARAWSSPVYMTCL